MNEGRIVIGSDTMNLGRKICCLIIAVSASFPFFFLAGMIGILFGVWMAYPCLLFGIYWILRKYISLCVEISPSWSVDQKYFSYHSDEGMTFKNKAAAYAEMNKEHYYLAGQQTYRYEEIEHVTLYTKERLGAFGFMAQNMRFKISLKNGVVLDKTMRLEDDDKKLYQAISMFKQHGVLTKRARSPLPLR